jgi:type I restriction enzyme R subunit
VEINIDYILELIRKYHDSHSKDKEILVNINKAIDSSVELRNKKELIEQFIDSLNVNSAVDADWHEFVDKKKIEELDKIITDETYKFIQNAFRDGSVQTTGTGIAKVLPGIALFTHRRAHQETGNSTWKIDSFL